MLLQILKTGKNNIYVKAKMKHNGIEGLIYTPS